MFNKVKEIHEALENIVSSKNCTYIEASIYYVENNPVDEVFMGEMINRIPVIKSKIEEEAEYLNLIKKKSDRINYEGFEWV